MTSVLNNSVSGSGNPQNGEKKTERVAVAADGVKRKPVCIAMASVIDGLKSGNSPTALPTGFVDLDRMLGGGFWPKQLVYLGARPSVGKTALALNISDNVAKNGGKVLFFSLEMSEAELAQRLLSSESGVVEARIRSGEITEDELEKLELVRDRFQEIQLFIDDTEIISIDKIRREVENSGPGLSLIVVDYTQLIQTGSTTKERYAAVAHISRGLKILATSSAVPVLALVQLNRQPEGRADRKPVLADMRESGSLEQDPNVVILLHKIDDTVINVNIAKNRNGQKGDISLVYEPDFTRFRNADIGSVAKLKASSDPRNTVTNRSTRRLLE